LPLQYRGKFVQPLGQLRSLLHRDAHLLRQVLQVRFLGSQGFGRTFHPTFQQKFLLLQLLQAADFLQLLGPDLSLKFRREFHRSRGQSLDFQEDFEAFPLQFAHHLLQPDAFAARHGVDFVGDLTNLGTQIVPLLDRSRQPRLEIGDYFGQFLQLRFIQTFGLGQFVDYLLGMSDGGVVVHRLHFRLLLFEPLHLDARRIDLLAQSEKSAVKQRHIVHRPVRHVQLHRRRRYLANLLLRGSGVRNIRVRRSREHHRSRLAVHFQLHYRLIDHLFRRVLRTPHEQDETGEEE